MPPGLSDPADLNRRRLAAAAAVCGVAFLLVAAFVTAAHTSPVDSWWAAVSARGRAAGAVWTAQALTVVGDVPVTTVLRVAGALWLLWRRRFTAFWAWAVAGALTPVVVQVIKEVVGRERPLDFVWTANGAAFPSGHAAAAATNAALVVLLLVPARHRRIATILGAAWTVAMAVARTVLGAHWLSDVVGGILLGLSVTCGVVAAVLTVADRRRGISRREEPNAWDARSPSPE